MSAPMLDRDREVILVDALRVYGEAAQVRMFVEEAGELMTALMQRTRDRVGIDDVVDEIADVQIILWQLMMMHDMRLVNAAIHRKMARLDERLRLTKAGKRSWP